mmetsp:Transcript_87227/g.154514  ORF Transcript_87227/g.154514 Transcript_87227/m.154514 type:complete len:353 (+) Transcript_87227:46-1104(+)
MDAPSGKRTLENGGSSEASKHLRHTSTLKLNVGGTMFLVSREVLGTFPASYFGSLAAGRIGSVQESDGSIFVDRDPEMFSYILRYLRTSGDCLNSLPQTDHGRSSLLTEAEYYGLQHLANVLRSSRVRNIFCASILEKKGGKFKIEGCHKSGLVFDVLNPHNFELDIKPNDMSYSVVGPSRAIMFFGVAPVSTDLASEWQMGEVDLRQNGETVAYEYPPAVKDGSGVFVSFWKVPGRNATQACLLDSECEFFQLPIAHGDASEKRQDVSSVVEHMGLRFFSSAQGGTIAFYWISPEGDYNELGQVDISAAKLPWSPGPVTESKQKTPQFCPVVFYGSHMTAEFCDQANWGGE